MAISYGGVAGPGAVALAYTNSTSWSHTMGADGVLFVVLGGYGGGGNPTNVSATYRGVAMTELANIWGQGSIQVLAIVATAGGGTVSVTENSGYGGNQHVKSYGYYGVSGWSTPVSGTSFANPVVLTASDGPGNWAFFVQEQYGGTITPSGGTQRLYYTSSNVDVYVADGSGVTTFSNSYTTGSWYPKYFGVTLYATGGPKYITASTLFCPVYPYGVISGQVRVQASFSAAATVAPGAVRETFGGTSLAATATQVGVDRYDGAMQAALFANSGTVTSSVLKTLNAVANLDIASSPYSTLTESAVATSTSPMTATPNATMSWQPGTNETSVAVAATTNTVGSRGQSMAANSTVGVFTGTASGLVSFPIYANLAVYAFTTADMQRGRTGVTSLAVTATTSGQGFETDVAAGSLTVGATPTAGAVRNMTISASLAAQALSSDAIGTRYLVQSGLALTATSFALVGEFREVVSVALDDRSVKVAAAVKYAVVGKESRLASADGEDRSVKTDLDDRGTPVTSEDRRVVSGYADARYAAVPPELLSTKV